MAGLGAARRSLVGVATVVLLAGCASGATPTPAPSSSAAKVPPTVAPTAGPTQSPSPTATPTPTLGPEPLWERLPEQDAFANATVSAVVAGPDRYVAVGTLRLAGDQRAGAAWWSTDGVKWVRAPTLWFDAWPRQVIHDRLGYVAWGLAGVWISPDGQSWTRAPGTAGFRAVEVSGMARLGDDLFVVGFEEIESGDGFVHDLRVLRSRDGLAWQTVSPVTSIPWDGYVYGLTATGDALVAWGYARVGDGFPPVSLRSTDGRRWDVSQAGLRVQGFMREGIGDIVATGGRLLAVGHGLGGEEGSPPPPSAAWTSNDGVTWTPAEFRPQPAAGDLAHVLWSSGAYVALGASGATTVVWRSIDGTTWIQAASVPDTARDGEEAGCAGGACPRTSVDDLAVGPVGLIAVGNTRTATGVDHAVVWIAASAGR